MMHRGVFMLCKPKPSALRRRIRRIVCTVTAAVLILSVYLEFAVKSQLTEVVAAGMKTLSQRAVNAAVIDYLSDKPDIGERLTVPHTAENGSVTSVTSDPTAINSLKASVSQLAQDYIGELADREGLSVPLGSFTGFFLFAELGPDIRMNIGSRQTVTCSLKSTFESAGVNQTLHHVILTVDVELIVYNPFLMRRAIHTSADFEIAQTVIVGSVPTYAPGSLWQ